MFRGYDISPRQGGEVEPERATRAHLTLPGAGQRAQILPNPSMPQVVVGMLLRRLAPSCGWSVQLLHELSSSAKV